VLLHFLDRSSTLERSDTSDACKILALLQVLSHEASGRVSEDYQDICLTLKLLELQWKSLEFVYVFVASRASALA